MTKKSLKKKIAAFISAGVLGVTALFTAAPAPVAEASLLEAIIGVGVQAAAVNQQLNYLNNDGRQEMYQSMQGEYGVYEDAEINAMLDRIMDNLSRGIAEIDPSINDKPYNYFVNQDTSFNAFCTVGHNLSVNVGLFSLLTYEDEVAVVLAHEMGHGQKEHVVKGFRKSIPVAIGSAVLAESTGGLGGAVLGAVLNNQLMARSITKPQEWEADNLAFDYICRTSYNPGACAAVWQRVAEKMASGGRDNFVGEIFSPADHPTNEQRRDNYAKKLTELSCNHITVADGTITVNGKNFLVCADDAANDVSAAERSFLVAGRLARLYENTDAEKLKKEQKKKKKKKNDEEDGEYKPRKFSLGSNKEKAAADGPAVRPLPQQAYAEDGNLYVDGSYILHELDGEPSAAELASLFNSLK